MTTCLNSVLKIPDNRRPRARSVQQGLSDCYARQLFCDAEVRVGRSTFRVHRCVLALHSPVFQRAFYGTRVPSAICIVNDVQPAGFDLLLRFIYSSTLPAQIDWKDVVHAIAAAELLQMSGTKEKLMNHVFHGFGFRRGPPAVQRFWPMLHLSLALKLADLEKNLLKFAEKNAAAVLGHEDFCKAEVRVARRVLGSADLAATGAELLESVARWKECNGNSDDLDRSVGELLSCVRFERMSPREFYEVVCRHDRLVPARQALDILMHLVDPAAADIPKWTSGEAELNNLSPPEKEISENLQENNNESSPKDKFKSMEDLQKTVDLSLKKNTQRLYASRSQVDLNKVDDSKTVGDWNSVDVSARWRGKTLVESFYQLMKEGLLTDVILEGSCGGPSVPAHRLVLALGSEVFAKLLYGTTRVDRILRLEATADEIQTLLRYFYGFGEDITQNSVHAELGPILRKLDLALKYDCYPLTQACWNALRSVPLNPRLFWKLMNRQDTLEMCKVRTEHLLRYAQNSPRAVLSDEGFFAAAKEPLIAILHSDRMNMAESEILDRVAEWLDRNESSFPTNPSRLEFFRCVRFQSLSAEEFYSFLKLHDDLMSKEDAFAILTHLFQRPGEPGEPGFQRTGLPDWCYRGPLRSFFYDPCSKIGTDVPVSWKTNPAKGRSSFRCSYTVTACSRVPEIHVQCLELSWQVRPKKDGRHIDHTCTVTIKFEDSEPLVLQDVPVLRPQRVVVPVHFTLNREKPKLQLDIEVNTHLFYAYYFLKQRKLAFENVVVEKTSEVGCLCDAVVDGRTSEGVLVPRHLLPGDSGKAIPTEKFLKVKSEDAV